MTEDQITEPTQGRWYYAEDIDKMVRELDVAMNGSGAAQQAKLCDIVGQLLKRISKADQLQAENAALRQALRDIADPVSAWRRDLRPGYTLDGAMCVQMRNDPETYKRLAREALAWALLPKTHKEQRE